MIIENTKIHFDDFNVVWSDDNGHFVRIEEINKMIECGAIIVNREKLEQYKSDTRVI